MLRLLLTLGLLYNSIFADPTSSQFAQRHFPLIVTDSVYNANHPRLLFNHYELPKLRQKVRDGGYDDIAYDYVRYVVDSIYPTKTELELMEETFGINVSLNLGLIAYLEIPPDTAAYEFGRHMTLFIADNYDPDDNVFYSPLRMRMLAFGYDMFFNECPDSVRTYIRNELLSYIDTTMTVFQYERWLHHPYVSNISSMIGSALGIAAICLENEIEPELVEAAVARADQFVNAWHQSLLDPNGTYHEGAMYAGWSLRNLVYYFWARKRCYDGYDFAKKTKIQNMEKWIAYSLLPQGGAQVNNINDTASLNYPLSRHHTYMDWAQSEWGSSLSAWLWDRIVGPTYGYESGILADKAATVFWHQNLLPQHPDQLLPKHFLWRQRGLYYYRTGWPDDGASDDVVFSFYSGKFQGGHKHEEQNSFTLHGYGAAFAVDNGFGGPAKESEAHNMVFINGKGQHNAGGSMGTDGIISEYILSDFADYLLGDATAAYNTYSEFNRAGYPFPDDDWSLGYDGGNPVIYALRRIIVVHDETTPPYFIILDDIEKDGQTHLYSWRLHTPDVNTVDITSNPIRIFSKSAYMDLHVINPQFNSLDLDLTAYDNDNPDPNTTILSVSLEAVNPHYAFIMIPANDSIQYPIVLPENYSWGNAVQLQWENQINDIILINRSEGHIGYSVQSMEVVEVSISTDARFALIRRDQSNITGYLVLGGSYLYMNNIPYVRVKDGELNCALSQRTIHIDRRGADFVFYAPYGGEVFYRDDYIPVLINNGYLIPDPSTGGSNLPSPPGFIKLRAYPNPFKKSTNVVVELEQRSAVTVTVYDIKGRFVRTICNGILPKGNNLLMWDGKNDNGEQVASGMYFINAKSGNFDHAIKVIVVN